MSTTGYELSVQPRSDLGKNAARRSRKAGMIPAIVYSHGKEGTPVAVDASEWTVLANHDFNLVTLVNGEEKIPALVKDVQINYLKSQVVHIDFQAVTAGEAITTSLAVHAVGADPVGLGQGGVLEQNLHEIEVKSIPSKLPETIEVKVADLQIEEAIHAKDIVLPEGVELLTDGDLVVFAVVKPAAVASAESKEEEA